MMDINVLRLPKNNDIKYSSPGTGVGGGCGWVTEKGK